MMDGTCAEDEDEDEVEVLGMPGNDSWMEVKGCAAWLGIVGVKTVCSCLSCQGPVAFVLVPLSVARSVCCSLECAGKRIRTI